MANFAGHLGEVGQAVDEWLASDMPDALASNVDWQGALSGPAPEHGIGAQATVDEYLRLILAHGTRLASSASWGWITTGPTTIPSVVAAGATAVAPQRQTVSAFHHVEELSLEWLASLRRVARATSIVLSSTFVAGSYALRPCFINARTSTADVDAFLDTVVRFGDETTAGLTAPEPPGAGLAE